LALFCLLVIISLIIWLIVWLINRGKDKKQRKELDETNNNNQNIPPNLQINTLESRHY
jgi:large-conductance mechanosensitive channel